MIVDEINEKASGAGGVLDIVGGDDQPLPRAVCWLIWIAASALLWGIAAGVASFLI